jgi:TRAP-type transport system periplasmic protein
MQNKKLVTLSFSLCLVVSLIVLSLLTACSSQSPATTSQTKTSATTPAAASGPIELKFAYWHPSFIYPGYAAEDAWAHVINEATNGRVTVKMFGDGAMGAPQDHYSLMTSGTADIVNFVPTFTPGQFPFSDIAILPNMFPSSEIAAGALLQFHKKYTNTTEFKDFHLLAIMPTEPQVLHTRTAQVKVPADLKGKKIAATGTMGTSILQSLGASGVFMPEGEVYTSLERGLVDGRIHEWDGAYVFKGMEVTKYRTGNINLGSNEMVIGMNKDTWNKLPVDIQNIITGASGELWSRNLAVCFDLSNSWCLQHVIDYDKQTGNPGIYWCNESEQKQWTDALALFNDKWATQMESNGLPAKQALADIKTWSQQYQKMWGRTY